MPFKWDTSPVCARCRVTPVRKNGQLCKACRRREAKKNG